MAGNGGPRPGSGRKPKLLTQLLLETETAGDDIAAAYRLFRDTMNDEGLPLPDRLDAAREILNRLCGKPAQSVAISGEDGGPVQGVVFYIPSNGRNGPPEDHPAPAGAPGDVAL